jgi:menaquinone-dependent protoporphyrinogen oxidase
MNGRQMILVAHATKYGATGEIASRTADVLTAVGEEAEAKPVEENDLTGYDAFVIGSAVYFGHWLNETTAFVRRNGAVLASCPVFARAPANERTDGDDQ